MKVELKREYKGDKGLHALTLNKSSVFVEIEKRISFYLHIKIK